MTFDLDLWYEPQLLQQQGEMDCGLCVFGMLTNANRDELLLNLPGADRGKTVAEWKEYLLKKGYTPIEVGGTESASLPCAHLVEVSPGRFHWIYQAANGGIHDPSPAYQHMPPRMIKLENYKRVLAISI